jgi:hypothetical protein
MLPSTLSAAPRSGLMQRVAPVFQLIGKIMWLYGRACDYCGLYL